MRNVCNLVPVRVRVVLAAIFTLWGLSSIWSYDILNAGLIFVSALLGLAYFLEGERFSGSLWTGAGWVFIFFLWVSHMKKISNLTNDNPPLALLLGTVLAVLNAILLSSLRASGVRISSFRWTIDGADGGSRTHRRQQRTQQQRTQQQRTQQQRTQQQRPQSEPERDFDVAHSKNAHPWWRGRHLPWGHDEVWFAYGRIPFTPFPFYLTWYCYSPKYQMIWKDSCNRHLDSVKLKNIYDFNFPKSGGPLGVLRGAATIEFIESKIHRDAPNRWNWVDPEWAGEVNLRHAEYTNK